MEIDELRSRYQLAQEQEQREYAALVASKTAEALARWEAASKLARATATAYFTSMKSSGFW